MRNALSELPVLLCCIWGGIASGGAAFLLRLPQKLYSRALKGRRSGLGPRLAFALADALAAAALCCGFALTLLHANGGEIRLFALTGFLLGAWLFSFAAKGALSLK